MAKYLKLMRVHHYVKNLLVFAALACSGKLFDFRKLAIAASAFLAFCMVSSAVYIINDICDREKDAKHPTKCKRPIAAGTVSVKAACVLTALLLVIAAVCNSFTFHLSSTALLLGYLVLNLAYSFRLKHIPIVDVAILVAGFLIRIVYGAIVTDITISAWLYLTVIASAFYFALGKRRNELRQTGDDETRPVLKAYPMKFLDMNMGMCLTLTNVFYALWSIDEKTTASYQTEHLFFTVPIVLLITMKYSLDIEGDSDGDPVEVLLHDKLLLSLVILYLVIMLVILYF